MNLRTLIITGLFVLTAIVCLNSFTSKKIPLLADDGKMLFTRYCTTCHTEPDPASLTKEMWQNHVLPIMASRMGIIYPNYDPLRGLSEEERAIVKKNNIIPDELFNQRRIWQNCKLYPE